MQDSQGNRSWVQRGVVVCVQLKRAQDAPLAAACQSCQHSSCLFLRGLSETGETRKRSCRTQKGSVSDTQSLGRGRGKGFRSLPNSQQLALPAPASSSSAPVSKSRGKARRFKGGGKGGKKVIDKTKTWQFKDLLRGPKKSRTCSRWKTSVSISRKACVRRVPSARESIAASVVVVPSRTMSATASNRRSRTCPEKHSHSLLRRMQLCCRFRQSLHL